MGKRGRSRFSEPRTGSDSSSRWRGEAGYVSPYTPPVVRRRPVRAVPSNAKVRVGTREPLLLTGGAGYVGSHAVLAFLDAGYRVVVLDNLATGTRSAVPPEAAFVEGDAGDSGTVGALIAEHAIGAVVHFAGSVVVPESVVDPLKYWHDNAVASAHLIRACVEGGVRRFVFSSSAAVYGIPSAVPVAEDMPAEPVNPYGGSKLAVERMLRDTAAAHDFRYTALRYFNVAGADPKGRAGQSTRDATHLVKVACEAAAGRRKGVSVFGTDYDTPDGTCVRDYIHVSDLAEVHVAALRDLEAGGRGGVLNCGYGRGYSVREVLEAVRSEAGVELEVTDAPRRAGDPPCLVSDTARLRAALEWRPRHDDLRFIVRTALAWERRIARAEPPLP